MSADARHFVIVGASLAGLRAAEALREGGFTGALTLVGDEPLEPYDRPPLSKQVMLGLAEAERTALPRARDIEAEWCLGRAAVGLDLPGRRVLLAGGEAKPFDKLLVATGTRARPWLQAAETALDGVLTLRTCGDAARLREALDRRPRRVVVIGGGFNGCELAAVCRELDLPVTLVEHNHALLAAALGSVVGRVATALQRENGVDVRCGSSVERLEGDAGGHVRAVHLAGDAKPVEADLVVVALGSLPNVEWLSGSGLAVGSRGLACDAGCRAFDQFGIATDDVYVAGDVARFPHPLFNFEFMTLEHWGNAVAMARIAAHNMLHGQGARRPHLDVPRFWSSQFGVSIKSVGVPPAADRVMVVQGAPERRAFVAVYGRNDRLVAAVAFNQGKWLEHYGPLIEAGAPFPESLGMDAPRGGEPMPPEFPHPSGRGLNAFITLSGHQPGDRRPTWNRQET